MGFNPQEGIQVEFRGPSGFFEKLEEILDPHLTIPPIQLRVKNNKVLWAYSAWLLGINLILQLLGGSGGSGDSVLKEKLTPPSRNVFLSSLATFFKSGIGFQTQLKGQPVKGKSNYLTLSSSC